MSESTKQELPEEGQVGLKTSDVYHVKNIPERFNNPGI